MGRCCFRGSPLISMELPLLAKPLKNHRLHVTVCSSDLMSAFLLWVRQQASVNEMRGGQTGCKPASAALRDVAQWENVTQPAHDLLGVVIEESFVSAAKKLNRWTAQCILIYTCVYINVPCPLEASTVPTPSLELACIGASPLIFTSPELLWGNTIENSKCGRETLQTMRNKKEKKQERNKTGFQISAICETTDIIWNCKERHWLYGYMDIWRRYCGRQHGYRKNPTVLRGLFNWSNLCLNDWNRPLSGVKNMPKRLTCAVRCLLFITLVHRVLF